MKYIFLVLPFLLLTSCSKEDSCQDCLETFRCKINGEKWSPQCDGYPNSWCPDVDCLYYEGSEGLEIRVVNRERNNRLRFTARGLLPFGTESNLRVIDREYINYTRGNCGGYDLIQELPNYVELTALDTVNYTVEGTFAFSVLGECDEDTLNVTDGYFHLAYRF